MPGAVVQGGDQLKMLDTGLKKLQKSKSPIKKCVEFRDMYEAIQKHHKDVKLSLLMSPHKEVIEKSEQNTKFFFILVSLLHQVTTLESLSQVYNWYLSNKHIVQTNKIPKFGKSKVETKTTQFATKHSMGKIENDALKIHLQLEEALKQQHLVEDEEAARISTNDNMVTPTPVKTTPVNEPPPLLPKRKAQPLAHLYNPHATGPGEGPGMGPVGSVLPGDQTKPLKLTESTRERRQTDPRLKWDMYLQDNNYGQNELSRLQHVGRGGLPSAVRYSAHDRCLNAEDYTQDIIATYAALDHVKPGEVSQTETVPATDQSLEAFYETVERRCESARSRRSAIHNNRTKSAPPGRRHKTCTSPDHVPVHRVRAGTAGGHQRETECDIRLDTMVRLITDVTEELTLNREKLVPSPIPGFRQPVVPYEASERPHTAPPGGALGPPSTPNSHAWLPFTHRPSDVRTLYSSPDGAPQQEQEEEAIDWRGRIAPSPTPHRWNQAAFGSHSYTKKSTLPSPGRQRGAGGAVAPPRPRTVPPSHRAPPVRACEDNERISQAASHSTTEMSPQSFAQLFNVFHLGGTTQRKARFYFPSSFDFKPDEHVASQSPPNMEYVSLIAPRPQDLMKKSTETSQPLKDSKRDMTSLDPFSWPPALTHLPGHQDAGSMQGDLDVPDLHELDDELNALDDLTSAREAGGTMGEVIDAAQFRQEVEQLVDIDEKTAAEVEKSTEDDDSLGSDRKPLMERVFGEGAFLEERHHLEEGQVSKEEQVLEEGQVSEEGHDLEEGQVLEQGQVLGQSEQEEGHISEEEGHISEEGHVSEEGHISEEGSQLEETVYEDELPQPGITQMSIAGVKLHDSRPTAAKHRAKPSHLHAAKSSQKSPRQQIAVRSFDTEEVRPESVYSGKGFRRGKTLKSAGAARHMCANLEQAELLKQRLRSAMKTPVVTDAGRSRKGGKIYSSELEAHARKDPQPKAYMDKVSDLRSVSGEGVEEEEVQTAPSFEVRPHAVLRAIKAPESSEMSVYDNAAIIIQSFFRGHLARKHCKLLREQKAEEKHRVKSAGGRAKRHQPRSKHDVSVTRMSSKMSTHSWAKQYRAELRRRREARENKAEATSRKYYSQKAAALARLAEVQSHDDIHSSFHQKTTNISGKLHRAAVVIQRWVRGFLVRRLHDVLIRKAKLHGGNLHMIVKQYKSLVKRIQRRLGVVRPDYSITYVRLNSYMDTKREREIMFERHAHGGMVSFRDLPDFFTDCDLFPSAQETEAAVQAIFRDKSTKRGEGLNKQDLLEVSYQMYPPPGSRIVIPRQSTWMNPIVDGREAQKFKGIEGVKPTKFEKCWNLVAESRRKLNTEKALEDIRRREEEWQKKYGRKSQETNSKPQPRNGRKENNN